MAKLRDLWAQNEQLPPRKPRTAETPTPAKPAKKNTFFKDPPVRVRITYESGREDVLTREQIDGDNPIIKALANIRTVRRFWRLNVSLRNLTYYTDEEVLQKADHEGLKTSDPVEAAKVMNMVSEYFVTDETGEPIEKDGKWVKATMIDFGAYTPTAPADDGAPAQPAT